MNNSKSITKNYLYNLIYQILIIIIPIITTPYVSRVLGADGVGKYSFSNSIVSYFVIFASLGFGYYAQREIAKYQGDKKKQSEIFWEIIIVRSVSVLTALIFYFAVICTECNLVDESALVTAAFDFGDCACKGDCQYRRCADVWYR